MNSIAGTIAQRRKKLGITQKELAEKLYVTDKTVSRWETGKQIPDALMMQNIAAALDISLAELYGDDAAADLRESGTEKRDLFGKIQKIFKYGALLAAVILGLGFAASNYDLSKNISCQIKNVPLYALSYYDHSVLDWIEECDEQGHEVNVISRLRHDAGSGEDIACYLIYLPYGDEGTELKYSYRQGLRHKTVKLDFSNMGGEKDESYCLCYMEVVWDEQSFVLETYIDGRRVSFNSRGSADFDELCEFLFN